MSFNIVSAGDIMLGENLHHYRRGVASRYWGRFKDLISPDVMAVINRADLFVGNLECSLLSDEQWKGEDLNRSMYAAPESALTLFKGWQPGIVLNVANNHFGQHGKSAAEYTVDCLRRSGIHCVGQTNRPLLLEEGPRRLVIWGVSMVKDPYTDAGYFKTSPDRLLEDMDWVDKAEGDVWIVCIHWGEEYMTCPGKSQVELAEKLIERGVDLILGHHPHVVQPVQPVKGRPVVYSHGNFIFDQNFSPLTQLGLLVEYDVDDGSVQIYKTGLKAFAVRRIAPWSEAELQRFCSKKQNRFRPLQMRILMKLELLLFFYRVPLELWTFFLNRLVSRLKT